MLLRCGGAFLADVMIVTLSFCVRLCVNMVVCLRCHAVCGVCVLVWRSQDIIHVDWTQCSRTTLESAVYVM
jgi:hypothetical protein